MTQKGHSSDRWEAEVNVHTFWLRCGAGPFLGPPQAACPRKPCIHSADQVLQQRARGRELI